MGSPAHQSMVSPGREPMTDFRSLPPRNSFVNRLLLEVTLITRDTEGMDGGLHAISHAARETSTASGEDKARMIFVAAVADENHGKTVPAYKYLLHMCRISLTLTIHCSTSSKTCACLRQSHPSQLPSPGCSAPGADSNDTTKSRLAT